MPSAERPELPASNVPAQRGLGHAFTGSSRFWWLLVILAVLPLSLCQLTSSDAWWHAATGRWLVEKHTTPDFASWYFTPTRPSVPDLRWTWLGDILLYFTARLGGAAAMTLLSNCCLALGLWLLRQLWPGRMNGWVALVLIAVAFGSYQLQLTRNAVFSLPLLAAVFVIFARSRQNPRWHWAWPLLIGLWGTLHGSSVLGLTVATLLVVGRWIERMVEKAPGRGREIGISAAALALAAGLTLIGNDSATQLLKRPFTSSVPSVPSVLSVPSITPATTAAAPATPAPPFGWAGIKWKLNHFIWNPESVGVVSGDFASPFDRFDYHPVPVSLGLAVLAILWLLLARGPRLGLFAGSLALFFLALCYFRMSGYAAIAAGAVFLGSSPRQIFASRGWRVAGRLGALALFAFLGTTALMGRTARVIGKPTHVLGLGPAPFFDQAVCAALLEPDFAGDEAFTTITSGSYALWEWNGRRRVFVDGFFSPHARSLWPDYANVRDGASPDLLVAKYGVKLALIDHERNDFNNAFLSAPNWRPVILGKGLAVFAHRSARSHAAGLRLLVAWADVQKMDPFSAQRLASNYYGALVSLALAGDLQEVRRVIALDEPLYRGLEAHLAGSQRNAVALLHGILEASEQRRKL